MRDGAIALSLCVALAMFSASARAEELSVWVTVFNFGSGGLVPIATKQSPRGYQSEERCARNIRLVRKRWEGLSLPPPESITCERMEIKQ